MRTRSTRKQGGNGVKRALTVLLAIVALVVTACGGGSKGNYADDTDKLEVMSWWVSPSEKPAYQTLLDAFKKANPNVQVEDNSIEGGAGGAVQIALAERLRSGNPPDSWQTFPGASLSAWVGAKRINDVADVYEKAGLAAQMPPALLDAVKVDGKPYGVPTGSHRQNNLFFNKKVLDKAGVAVPADGYTAEQWTADLEKIVASGVSGLCLGGKDRFTAVELFENTLFGVVGADGWKRVQDDRFDWSGSDVKTALSTFAGVLKNADPASGGMSWDQAAKDFAGGKCGFLSMNDSAYAEIVKNGAMPGEGFGYVAYPGTRGSYLAVVDTFVVATGAKNGVNAKKFLEVLADPAVSPAFNKEKGSVPIRKDVDVATLSEYQRDASKSLWNDKVLLSMTHGELIDPTLQQALYSAVIAFVQSKNERAFIDTLQTARAKPVLR